MTKTKRKWQTMRARADQGIVQGVAVTIPAADLISLLDCVDDLALATTELKAHLSTAKDLSVGSGHYRGVVSGLTIAIRTLKAVNR